eukprot:1011220-Pyramimonas_sp.AAC.1
MTTATRGPVRCSAAAAPYVAQSGSKPHASIAACTGARTVHLCSLIPRSSSMAPGIAAPSPK